MKCLLICTRMDEGCTQWLSSHPIPSHRDHFISSLLHETQFHNRNTHYDFNFICNTLFPFSSTSANRLTSTLHITFTHAPKLSCLFDVFDLLLSSEMKFFSQSVKKRQKKQTSSSSSWSSWVTNRQSSSESCDLISAKVKEAHMHGVSNRMRTTKH